MNIKSHRDWSKSSKNIRNRFPNRNLESNISMDLGDNQSKIDDKFMEIDGQNNFSNLSTDELNKVFELAIYVLEKCDERKRTWVGENEGKYINTCGYSGPGIAIILNLFIENNIKTYEQFYKYIATLYIDNFDSNSVRLIDTINDTILNFLDIANFCPITKVEQGIMGLAKESHPEIMQTKDISDFYPIKFSENGTNLQEGVNLIAFTDREVNVENLCTFHHSVLYIHNKSGMGYIIDSWATPQNCAYEARPIEVREYKQPELFHTLYIITHSENRDEIFNTINKYFKAHTATLQRILYNIGITNPNKIKEVYAIAKKQHDITRARGGRYSSALIKRNQTKKNKKIKKQKNKNKNKNKKSKKMKSKKRYWTKGVLTFKN
jgi:hypothetical protein